MVTLGYVGIQEKTGPVTRSNVNYHLPPTVISSRSVTHVTIFLLSWDIHPAPVNSGEGTCLGTFKADVRHLPEANKNLRILLSFIDWMTFMNDQTKAIM